MLLPPPPELPQRARRLRTARVFRFLALSLFAILGGLFAARVAVAKPSHSVRPGSLTCTWLSTRPGITIEPSPASTILQSVGTSSKEVTAAIRPAFKRIDAGINSF